MTDDTTAVTVYLTPESLTALDALKGALGMNRADVINRALQFYALIEAERRAGGEVLIQTVHGQIDRLKF